MEQNEQGEIVKAYYAVIPANVRYDNDVPPNAKLLYGEITALCNQKGYCWATNDYFAKLYGCTSRTVTRWIGLLKERGYIAVELIYKEGSKEIENRYIKISNAPYGQNCLYPYGQKSVDPIDKNVYTPTDKNVQDNNTYSFNNTENITVKKEERKKDSFNQLIDDYASTFDEPCRSEVIDLLGEWLKVRKAKRAAMTDRAIQMNIAKLDELANKSNMTVVDYLTEVIRRGWAAFYVIKDYQPKQNTKPQNTGNVFLELLNEGKGIYYDG